MKEIITAKRMEELERIAIKVLTDKTAYGGAWFETEEEAEKWMGDCFFETLWAILEELGYKIEDDEEAEMSEPNKY